MIDRPPTIIVVHPREKRSKCSVEHLRGSLGFQFETFGKHDDLLVDDYVRLDVEGLPLSSHDQHRGLLVLDATWRLAGLMRHDYLSIEARSLPRATSAYPRTSKMTVDPSEGLATIEAIYLAHLILGRPTAGLFDAYRWGEEFLTFNDQLIRSLARRETSNDQGSD